MGLPPRMLVVTACHGCRGRCLPVPPGLLPLRRRSHQIGGGRRHLHHSHPNNDPHDHHHDRHELVRRYVGRQLGEYYAQPAGAVVGRTKTSSDVVGHPIHPPRPPLFGLWGEWHWRHVLLPKLYEERDGGRWLTPVELFRPHYSRIMANFCVRALLAPASSQPGPGQGHRHRRRRSGSNNNNDGNNDDNNDVCNDDSNDVSNDTYQSSVKVEIVEIGGGRGTNAELILDYLEETEPQLYERLTYTLVDSSSSLLETQRGLLMGGRHAERVRFEWKDMMDVAEGT
jgi:Putative S-adenosyl-L-methionine-dependent methyltransferase